MLWSALIFGLLGSFHCIGMCGPIAFMLPVEKTNNFKKFNQVLLYHFGRILAYSFIGLFFGLIGKSLFIFGFQQQLSIIIGVIMILAVWIPMKTVSKYNFSRPIFKIISKVKNALGTALQKKTADTFFTIGFLNGFLPCGLVYMAVFGSMSTGNALHGSLYMILFGLGTAPLMTTAVYAGNYINRALSLRIKKAIPIFIVVIGVLFIIRGMGLGIPFLSPKYMAEIVTSQMECMTY